MTTINYKGKLKLLLSMLIFAKIRKYFPERIIFKLKESYQKAPDLYQITFDIWKFRKEIHNSDRESACKHQTQGARQPCPFYFSSYNIFLYDESVKKRRSVFLHSHGTGNMDSVSALQAGLLF